MAIKPIDIACSADGGYFMVVSIDISLERSDLKRAQLESVGRAFDHFTSLLFFGEYSQFNYVGSEQTVNYDLEFSDGFKVCRA